MDSSASSAPTSSSSPSPPVPAIGGLELEFIEFYREYAPKVFAYCFTRVNSKEDAEDLASKTFTKTWDYLAAGNTIEHLRAFVYRTARNLVIDFYKTSKHDREVSIHAFDGDTADLPDTTNMGRDAEARETLRTVMKSLEELPEDYRELIILRHLHELSPKEIAETTGMTENNVSVKLHRATLKLKSLTPAYE